LGDFGWWDGGWGGGGEGEWAKKTHCHFEQVDFKMSSVTGVVFLTSKIKTT